MSYGTLECDVTELHAYDFCNKKETLLALAGVAQWIECWPANQRVAGSMPSQGTCMRCGPGPQ